MHKTGTTFLQWNVYPFLDVNYLWHFFYKSPFNDILNPKKEVDYKKIKQKLTKVLSKDKVNIISEENIYTYQFTKEDDRFKRLERMKKVFPKARIIFGSRKAEDSLISWYVEYVAVGGVLDYQGFLDKYMNLDKLDYEHYIKKLQEFYGKKNVFIYSINELRKNQDQVIKNICRFIGVESPENYRRKPARVGYGFGLLKLSLFLNRFFKTRVNEFGIIPFWGPILPQNVVFHSSIVKYFPQKKITMDDLLSLKIPEEDIVKPRIEAPLVHKEIKRDVPLFSVKGFV